MLITDFPANQISAAFSTALAVVLGLFLAGRAFHANTYNDPSYDNAGIAAGNAGAAAGLFLLSGAPILFITPVIAGFLFVVAGITFCWGLSIEWATDLHRLVDSDYPSLTEHTTTQLARGGRRIYPAGFLAHLGSYRVLPFMALPALPPTPEPETDDDQDDVQR